MGSREQRLFMCNKVLCLLALTATSYGVPGACVVGADLEGEALARVGELAHDRGKVAGDIVAVLRVHVVVAEDARLGQAHLPAGNLSRVRDNGMSVSLDQRNGPALQGVRHKERPETAKEWRPCCSAMNGMFSLLKHVGYANAHRIAFSRVWLSNHRAAAHIQQLQSST